MSLRLLSPSLKHTTTTARARAKTEPAVRGGGAGGCASTAAEADEMARAARRGGRSGRPAEANLATEAEEEMAARRGGRSGRRAETDLTTEAAEEQAVVRGGRSGQCAEARWPEVGAAQAAARGKGWHRRRGRGRRGRPFVTEDRGDASRRELAIGCLCQK
ncbi:hypothetical protein U9M48_033769 [Paspalum notatum var. saurae]|uniref:Uncharacterized protein n=1 Tax=Paspalum notatum var. saurae TaxID=547442 RepID=A0AAQ3UC62_PASNO